MDSAHTVDKYLAHYAEPIAREIATHSLRNHDYVLVIPAFREGQEFIENLRAIAAHHESALIIVVINEPESDQQGHVENLVLERDLLALGRAQKLDASIHVVELKNQTTLMVMGPLVLDRRHGVGLARKIGCDSALTLIRRGVIAVPIIYSTDADARLPTDYFSRARNALHANQQIACLIYPFHHVRPQAVDQRIAIELYERRLMEYVDGLMRAGSPYAFHTIGSTLAIVAAPYAHVRGFQKIAAGEDFYILNKLKKMGAIIQMSGDPIKLSARLSSRVPFGTGPALTRMVAADPKAAKIFYHPQVFEYLGAFLDDRVAAILGRTHVRSASIDYEFIDQAFLSLKGGEKLAANLAARKQPKDRLKAFHDWFDGFRTLKMVHFFRDQRFQSRSFNEVGD